MTETCPYGHLHFGPTYAQWPGEPKKKATTREWSLVRALLLYPEVHWLDGFLFFEVLIPKSW